MTHQAGELILVSNKGFVSSAIRVATRSHWSHVGIFDGNGHIIEALGRGVVKSPEDKYDHVSHACLRIPGADGEKIKQAAQRMRGYPYNYWAILVFALRTLGMPGITGKRRPWFLRWLALLGSPLAEWADRRKAYICSEVAVIACRGAGVDPWGDRLASTISPGTFSITALTRGWDTFPAHTHDHPIR